MTLLFYSKKMKRPEKQLLMAIGLLLSKDQYRICRSIRALSKELRQPVVDTTIAILLASSREDLQDILSVRDLLWNTKVILIVPDADPETVAKGHTLRPRFLSDYDNYFLNVADVLGLMKRNLEMNA